MSLRNARHSTASLCVLMVLAASACRTSPEAKEAKYLKRGEALLAKKDYSRALLEFRNASGVMPKDAEPFYQMGLAYLGARDLVNAVQSFRKASAINPKHQKAQLKLADILASTQDQQLIEEAASRVLDAFGPLPGDPAAINALALTEWKLGKPEEAEDRLQEALRKFPAELGLSVELARMKLSSKDWNGAEAVLKKALQDAPKSSAAERALGEFYIYTRQPAKAESELKRAVQFDPKNGAALVALAGVQVSLKKMDEAGQTYKLASALPDKSYKPLHAIFLYQSGNRDAAMAELQALFKSDPDDRDARTRLVTAYLGMNRVAEAEEVLVKALQRHPKDTDALAQRAELRLRAGKIPEAEADLKEVLHFKPDSATAHFLMAGVFRAQGQPARQQQELQEALRLNPEFLVARLTLGTSFLSMKQPQAALDTLSQASEPQKKLTPWIIGHNWALLAAGNIPEAKAGIEKALQAGRPPDAVFQDAVRRSLERDYIGARAEADELLKADRLDADLINLLMQTYVARQELAKGVERLREIAAEKRSAPLQFQLGKWSQRAGDAAGARQAFESAKAADPKFGPADLALAEMDILEGHFDAALGKLRAILANNPKDVPAMLLTADADDAAGDHAGSIGMYRAVVDVDRSNVIALNNLAFHLVTSDPDEALKFAQKAVEMAPDSPIIQDTLGWVYYHKGLYDMAVRFLKTAVDKEANPRRQYHLGMTYLKTGDQEAGRKIVREALQKDPDLVKTEAAW